MKIPVAIKVLNGDILPAQNNELLEEARVMAAVNHKNCIRILAICMTEQMMIITQLMPFGSLREYVYKERTNIGSQVLLNWCMQIARVSAYLLEKLKMRLTRRQSKGSAGALRSPTSYFQSVQFPHLNYNVKR